MTNTMRPILGGMFTLPGEYFQPSEARYIPLHLGAETVFRSPIWSFGNSKLGRLVPAMAFPVRETCSAQCRACYARRMEGLRPSYHFKSLLTYLAFCLDRQTVVEESKALLRGVQYARFLVGGDVTAASQKTFEQIIIANPQTRFLMFSKSHLALSLASLQNLALKYTRAGELNYGTPAEVQAMAAESGGYVCPHSSDRKHECGDVCKLCWETGNRRVYFIKH